MWFTLSWMMALINIISRECCQGTLAVSPPPPPPPPPHPVFELNVYSIWQNNVIIIVCLLGLLRSLLARNNYIMSELHHTKNNLHFCHLHAAETMGNISLKPVGACLELTILYLTLERANLKCHAYSNPIWKPVNSLPAWVNAFANESISFVF